MKIIGKFRNPILIYVSVRDDAPSAYIEVNIRQLCNNQVGKLTIHFVLRIFFSVNKIKDLDCLYREQYVVVIQ